MSYFNEYYGLDITADLITLSELRELGCSVPEYYRWGTSSWSCFDSQYASWIVNDQFWWTRSIIAEDRSALWYMNSDGTFDTNNAVDETNGICPVITISKTDLENYI